MGSLNIPVLRPEIIPAEDSLLGRKFIARQSRWWQRHDHTRSQQHNRVGQQTGGPGQAQAVEEHGTQPQRVLLIRLGGLNPRLDLLQQSASNARSQGNLTLEEFPCMAGSITELAGTGTLTPNPTGLSGSVIGHAQPVELVARFPSQPTQGLTLRTDGHRSRFKRFYQVHVGPQLGQHAHAQALPYFPLNLLAQPPRSPTTPSVEANPAGGTSNQAVTLKPRPPLLAGTATTAPSESTVPLRSAGTATDAKCVSCNRQTTDSGPFSSSGLPRQLRARNNVP